MKKRKLIAIAGMVLVMGSVLPVSAAESLADFDYQTYADTYPDLKAAFGYDAAALYNHYETNGKAEGRVAIFTDGASSATTVESLATFDYKAYADTYPDLKAAFGYDAASLYNHYVNSGKAEGRVAVFTAAATAQPAQTATTTKTTVSEKLDPLPPLNPSKMPDWFDARTPVESMTNARLVAEYNALVPYMEEHDLSFEGPLSRKEELLSEMNIRLTRYDYYEDYKDAFGEKAAAGIKKDPAYQRAAASDITPLREFMG